MSTRTKRYDPAVFLTDRESIAAYLADMLESGDAGTISHALGVVARAKGMATVAKQAGLSREHLYRALSDRGNPELSTMMKVLDALGLRLAVEPAAPRRRRRVAAE